MCFAAVEVLAPLFLVVLLQGISAGPDPMRFVQMCNTVIRHTVHTSTNSSTPQASPQSSASRAARTMARHLSTPLVKAAPHSSNNAAKSPGNVASQTSPHAASLTSQNSGTTTRTAQLYALAEQYDLKGLQSAIEGIPSRQASLAPSDMTSTATPSAAALLDLPSTPTRARSAAEHRANNCENGTGAANVSSGRHTGSKKVPNLDVLEADVVVLLVALCRLAARQGAAHGEANVYVTAGKFLASDILLRARPLSCRCGSALFTQIPEAVA
jgi:hypothetical protein